jgi:hypothetical protein
MNKPFEPCAIEYRDANFTELVLRDCTTVYVPLGDKGVELGYDEHGTLIVVRVPGLVATRKSERERTS